MVKFDEVKKGYKKEQVDEYINTVSAEYEILHEEFKTAKQEIEELKEKEEKLHKEIKHLASDEHSNYQEVISSAILSAETSAKKIVADAKEEATYMNEMAKGELDALVQTKQGALGEVRELTDSLLGLLREEQGSVDFYAKRMMAPPQERK
jgi:DivIVA protein.